MDNNELSLKDKLKSFEEFKNLNMDKKSIKKRLAYEIEELDYLFCYVLQEEDETDEASFIVFHGREPLLLFIKGVLQNLVQQDSFIISSKATLDEAISVRQFLLIIKTEFQGDDIYEEFDSNFPPEKEENE